MRNFLIAIALIISSNAPAAIYKCKTPDGKTVFSQIECAPTAERVPIKPNVTVHPEAADTDPQSEADTKDSRSANGDFQMERPPSYDYSAATREKNRIRNELMSLRGEPGEKKYAAYLRKRLWEIEEHWYQTQFYGYRNMPHKKDMLCKYYWRRVDELKVGILKGYLVDIDVSKHSKQYAAGIKAYCPADDPRPYGY